MTGQSNPLKANFMRWQCRVRQMAMRDNAGRPDEGLMPSLTLSGETEPMGNIITLISKNEANSKVPEMLHMFKQTFDPVKQREKALQFFSEVYYQKADQFSEVLTCTLSPDSKNTQKILDSGSCTLGFEAYNQRYDLVCDVSQLSKGDYLYQATWCHNQLFNPSLPPDTVVLAFQPDFDKSVASSVV